MTTYADWAQETLGTDTDLMFHDWTTDREILRHEIAVWRDRYEEVLEKLMDESERRMFVEEQLEAK